MWDLPVTSAELQHNYDSIRKIKMQPVISVVSTSYDSITQIVHLMLTFLVSKLFNFFILFPMVNSIDRNNLGQNSNIRTHYTLTDL